LGLGRGQSEQKKFSVASSRVFPGLRRQGCRWSGCRSGTVSYLLACTRRCYTRG
jgi:hypothetical protein